MQKTVHLLTHFIFKVILISYFISQSLLQNICLEIRFIELCSDLTPIFDAVCLKPEEPTLKGFFIIAQALKHLLRPFSALIETI